MKKEVFCMMLIAATSCIFTACKGKSVKTTENRTDDSVRETTDTDAAMEKKAAAMRQAFGGLGYTFGTITKFGEEETADWERNKDADWAGGSVTRNIKSFNSISQMVLALNSDKLDCVFIPEVVANYLKKLNPEYVVTSGFGSYDSFIMGVRPEDIQLRDDINRAVEEMKADGTLTALEKEHLTDVKNNTLNVPVAGRKTLKVIITGDYAPVDYVSPVGTPQGYNVAIMQKIGEKLGVNIEFVTVEAPARLLALKSKRGDVIFWIQAEHNGEMEISSDEFGDELLITKPYLTCNAASVTRSQEKTDIIENAFAKLAELVRE